MDLIRIFQAISDILNAIGVLILAIGALGSAVWFTYAQVRRVLSLSSPAAVLPGLNDIRKFMVERTILSLDFFVGADIIKTVARLTFRDLGLLAGIVVIRVVLAYFLERELGTRLPE